MSESTEDNPYRSPVTQTPVVATCADPVLNASGETSGVGCIAVLGLSIFGMFLAATILGCAISGLTGLLAGPFLVLFGWFYLPVIIGLHVWAWFAWPWCKRRGMRRISFGLVGALIAASLFAVIGIKEQGRVLHFTVAYAIAAAVSAYISCIAIATIRQHTNASATG